MAATEAIKNLPGECGVNVFESNDVRTCVVRISYQTAFNPNRRSIGDRASIRNFAALGPDHRAPCHTTHDADA